MANGINKVCFFLGLNSHRLMSLVIDEEFVCFIALTILCGKPYVFFKLLLVRMKCLENEGQLGQSYFEKMSCDVKMFF